MLDDVQAREVLHLAAFSPCPSAEKLYLPFLGLTWVISMERLPSRRERVKGPMCAERDSFVFKWVLACVTR